MIEIVLLPLHLPKRKITSAAVNTDKKGPQGNRQKSTIEAVDANDFKEQHDFTK